MRRTIAIVIAASFAGIILFSGIGQAQGLKLAFVDFEKLEEVLVVLNLPPHTFDSAP